MKKIAWVLNENGQLLKDRAVWGALGIALMLNTGSSILTPPRKL